MKKYSQPIEIIGFYGLLFLINWLLFPQMLSFLDVDPHPFWIGILLFGFRYGVLAGFSSGVLSCALYLAGAWLIGEQYRFDEFNFYLLPSFFIFVGVFIGVVTAKNRERIRVLEEKKSLMHENMSEAKKEIQTLQEINRGLEKRIVSKMSTMVTLYEGARRLEAMDLDELYQASVEFIGKTLEAEEVSLYLKDEKGWKLFCRHGAKEYQKTLEHIQAGEGITGLAGSKGKIVTIRDFLSSDSTASNGATHLEFMGDALIAGPLRAGEKGEVVGVVSIQKIPFEMFHSASVNLFSFLLVWCSRSIERAHYIQSLKDQEILNPELQIYSVQYFQRRLQQEFLRSKTYYLPLSIGMVKIQNLDLMSREKQRLFMVAFSELLKKSCREMDVVASFDEPGIPFAILWITANEKQVQEMKKTILNNYKKMDPDAFAKGLKVEIGVSSFSPQVQDAKNFIAQAKEGIHA